MAAKKGGAPERKRVFKAFVDIVLTKNVSPKLWPVIETWDKLERAQANFIYAVQQAFAGCSWEVLKEFIEEATGKVTNYKTFSDCFNVAQNLMHAAMGVKNDDSFVFEDVDVLKDWPINCFVTRSKKMSDNTESSKGFGTNRKNDKPEKATKPEKASKKDTKATKPEKASKKDTKATKPEKASKKDDGKPGRRGLSADTVVKKIKEFEGGVREKTTKAVSKNGTKFGELCDKLDKSDKIPEKKVAGYVKWLRTNGFLDY